MFHALWRNLKLCLLTRSAFYVSMFHVMKLQRERLGI